MLRLPAKRFPFFLPSSSSLLSCARLLHQEVLRPCAPTAAPPSAAANPPRNPFPAFPAANQPPLLRLNAAEMYVDVEHTDAGASTQWLAESGVLDLFLLLGPRPADLSRQFAALTGGTALPQLFSLGYHQCRWNYKDERGAWRRGWPLLGDMFSARDAQPCGSATRLMLPADMSGTSGAPPPAPPPPSLPPLQHSSLPPLLQTLPRWMEGLTPTTSLTMSSGWTLSTLMVSRSTCLFARVLATPCSDGLLGASAT